MCRHALMRCTTRCSPTNFSWTPTSWSCSGVPLLASSINYQDWAWYHHFVNGCARSRYLYQHWSQHADTCPAVCHRCFAVLHQLHSICRFVPSSVYQSLVVALVLSRLDYGNVTVAGLPACLLNRLQSVLNLAARSITGLRCSEHITDASEHITDALASFHSAPSTWAHHVQTGGHCLLSSSQHCTSVLVRSAAACRWSADETSRPAAFVNFQSSRRPPIAACYCQQSLFCCCWPTTLEQSTCRRPVCPITRNILSETENAFISAIIPDIVL